MFQKETSYHQNQTNQVQTPDVDYETIETIFETNFIKNCIEPTDDKLGCTLQSFILFHSEMQKGGGKEVTTFMGKTPQLLIFACRSL